MRQVIRAALARACRWAGAGGAVLVVGACGASLADRGIVRETVGRATARDIRLEVPDVLGEQGFVINETTSTGRRIRYETDWMPRAPFEDEADLGAEEARTRVTITARESAANLYTVDVRVENEVRRTDTESFMTSGWSTIPTTEMYRDYVRRLLLTIELRINAGVRIRGVGDAHVPFGSEGHPHRGSARPVVARRP